MQRFLLAGLAAFCFLVFPGRAAADSTFQIVGFVSGPDGFIGLTPFDPSLGTLTSVDVSIQGQLSATLQTFQNPCAPAGVCPLPYLAAIDQNFFGLAGRYFTFGSNAEFQFTGLASGAGESLPLIETYTYNFTFNSFTDLVGFAVLNPSFGGPASLFLPPITVNGTVSGFQQSIIPINEVDEVVSPGATAGGVLTGLTDAGSISITYNYTPPPPPTVPEPSSLLLLVCGLPAVFFRSRLLRWPRRNLS